MIRLQQRSLLGFLLDPFGRSVRAIELDGDHITITRGRQVATVSLQALTHAPDLRKGMLGTALTINSQEHNDVTLKGAGHVAAREFAEEVKEAWTRVNLVALDKEAARLDRVLAGVLGLAACKIAPLMDDAKALDASLLSKLNAEAIGPEVVARIATVRKFASDPRAARANAIAAFVTAELDRWKDFFDTIESKPLTQEQRLSVVVDEDATLVLAGAGSGKTSVITINAAYLVKAGIRQPEEILLLAFAKNAAEEKFGTGRGPIRRAHRREDLPGDCLRHHRDRRRVQARHRCRGAVPSPGHAPPPSTIPANAPASSAAAVRHGGNPA